jgi:hypothetical protein
MIALTTPCRTNKKPSIGRTTLFTDKREEILREIARDTIVIKQRLPHRIIFKAAIEDIKRRVIFG